jgi:hypothetical protein
MNTIRELNPKALRFTQPPAYLSNALRVIGGVNPYGDPIYRLVRAEERLTPSGGTWITWDKRLTIKERNAQHNNPYSRKVEVRLIRRYGPATGWVLERWVPAKVYGPRERWYSPASVGGTLLYIRDGNELKYVPSQGEYPAHGDYEYTGYSFESHELSMETVRTAVQIMKRGIEKLPANPAARVARRAQIARAANEAADQAYDKWADEIVTDRFPAFGGNPFAGAGLKREHSTKAILDRLGIKEHHI